MPLLRPRDQRKRAGKRLPEYRTLLCPRYGYRNTWCRQLCTPIEGQGDCGRLAPHSLTGRTQAAIAAYNAVKSGG
jgi:hypothetical protein